MTEPMSIDPAPTKVDGRTKAARAARNAAKLAETAVSLSDTIERETFGADANQAPIRRAVRGNMRDQQREPMRSARGGILVQGRNGEVLTRTRKGGIDPFDIPLNMIPSGWRYQWCAEESYGNKEVMRSMMLEYQQNGWRPVPAERHDGYFMPKGHSGHITVRGQLLMERPAELDDEAKAEDLNRARRQMQDRDNSLLGSKANVRANMPGGFEMNPGKYRGTGGDLRMSIDKALDIPSPSYEVAENQG